MRGLRFGLLGLCVGLVACSGSSFDLSDSDDDGGIDALDDASADGVTVDGGVDSGRDSAGGDSASGDGGVDTAVADSGIDTAVADSGIDTAVTDSGIDTAVTDSAIDTAVTDTADAATDGGCPTLVLGGATEDVYVDKGVASSGNGTKACPFKTILSATALAAPAAGVTTRTIHVRGNAAAPDYVESGALFLRARVILTSNYDTPTDGAAANVRIIARGDCTTLTGAATTTFCAVGMDAGSRLELVTVRSTAGVSTGHSVLTTSTLPTSGVSAPTIVDVNAENANEAAIRSYGSVSVGPRVNATNSGQGFVATRAAGLAQAVIGVVNVATVTGAPTNSFSSNRGNGFGVFGDFAVTIGGASATGNGGNGLVIGVPFTLGTSTTVQHLANIQATGNTFNGLRVLSGDVKVETGTWTNRFDSNGQYGLETTNGDVVGTAHLVLDPKLDAGGAYLIGHQAMHNTLGGAHLNNGGSSMAAACSFSSLNASQNGSPGAAVAYGIFVHIAGATSPNQSSLILRGSTLLLNTGAGLRFQKGASNGVDAGTATAGGFNIWGDATPANRNAKSAICYENMSGAAVVQLAEMDRWSQSCPLPLSSGSFQASLGSGGCSSNGSYIEITYTGSTAPIPAVTSCY